MQSRDICKGEGRKNKRLYLLKKFSEQFYPNTGKEQAATFCISLSMPLMSAQRTTLAVHAKVILYISFLVADSFQAGV